MFRCVRIRFLVDEMLGDVSRWLRMLGYDTKFAKDYEIKYDKVDPDVSVKDSDLINECFNERRILITRDIEMSKIMEYKFDKLLKDNPEGIKQFDIPSNNGEVISPCILLREKNNSNRLKKIYKKFKISLDYIPEIARCPKCNSKLMIIEDKSLYKEIIPEKVYAMQEEFWKCKNDQCSNIYWKGTHIEEIIKKLETIKQENKNST